MIKISLNSKFIIMNKNSSCAVFHLCLISLGNKLLKFYIMLTISTQKCKFQIIYGLAAHFQEKIDVENKLSSSADEQRIHQNIKSERHQYPSQNENELSFLSLSTRSGINPIKKCQISKFSLIFRLLEMLKLFGLLFKISMISFSL